ncbi:DUF4097 family beta strand repeat-containing protein [Arenimonas daejeonensis]|uniref:DUF4097 family beta strand repeat-containing protein n=1 Tax=Arenimonas daejeonensis TaxID=370777 RepID=UPI0011BDA96F|nr:DUF4097 family beta strand repeat-containing protein [Arenimonas daejeonensis]
MKSLALIALLCPALAAASDCEHSQDRSLTLDLAGVRSVRIEIGSNDLRLAPSGAADARFGARACASSPELFEQLTLEQRREGDRLVIVARRDGYSVGWIKPKYAYLEIDARLPASLAYEVKVGSGDADVSGLGSLRADVGSGDIEVRDIAGLLEVEVGSGDVLAENVGELRVDSVGSGDLEASGVRGDVLVRDIGSGDVDLRRVGGNVEIASIGSGDADVDEVTGDLRVIEVGSGEVSPSRIGGRTTLPADD